MNRAEILDRVRRVERIKADKNGDDAKAFKAKMIKLASSPEWEALKDHMAGEIYDLANTLNIEDRGGNVEMLVDIRRRQTEARTYRKLIEDVERALKAPFSDKKAGVTHGNQER
jgi:hypothetical protein